jgi:CheY-like chemotaxis protein
VRLRQVLINLAGNAIKFTEQGGVTVSVRVEFIRGDDVCVEFAVRDTGIGISSGDLERIFEPFVQADSSTCRSYGGTGLGLSISATLIALMGGRIWADSEVGQGSTFYFTACLPRATRPPVEPESSSDLSAAPAAVLRILLIEDNPANQKLATYILQERGHIVDVAGNGRQALPLVQDNRYDVILMDLQMPDMDGLQTTAAIRTRECGGCHVPIVAMTAHAMKGDREQCLEHGMDGYLSKPIDAGEMIALVEGLASGAVSTRHQPDPATERTECAPAVVFDRDVALKRCGGSPDLLATMVKCFVDEIRELLPQLRAAVAEGNLAAVAYLGHRIKGTTVYLGAPSAEAAAIAVEQIEVDSRPAEAAEAVQDLERECKRLEAVLAS